MESCAPSPRPPILLRGFSQAEWELMVHSLYVRSRQHSKSPAGVALEGSIRELNLLPQPGTNKTDWGSVGWCWLELCFSTAGVSRAQREAELPSPPGSSKVEWSGMRDTVSTGHRGGWTYTPLSVSKKLWVDAPFLSGRYQLGWEGGIKHPPLPQPTTIPKQGDCLLKKKVN